MNGIVVFKFMKPDSTSTMISASDLEEPPRPALDLFAATHEVTLVEPGRIVPIKEESD